MAENKGRKRGGYIAMFVILWILGEFIGAFAGAMATRSEGFEIYIFAILGAGVACGLSFLVMSILSDKTIVEVDNSRESFSHLN